jgi:hypothetical protein
LIAAIQSDDASTLRHLLLQAQASGATSLYYLQNTILLCVDPRYTQYLDSILSVYQSVEDPDSRVSIFGEMLRHAIDNSHGEIVDKVYPYLLSAPKCLGRSNALHNVAIAYAGKNNLTRLSDLFKHFPRDLPNLRTLEVILEIAACSRSKDIVSLVLSKLKTTGNDEEQARALCSALESSNDAEISKLLREE